MKRQSPIRSIVLLLLALLALIVLAAWFLLKSAGQLISIEHSDRIDLTPEKIQSIRDIGQWEFLAVTDEELVDTTRWGLFSDDHLSRIYYGTLRLGIDMSQLGDDWFATRGDTLHVTLPPVTLLDEHFIDEARTRAFHESGRWKAEDREAMYQRAQQLMKAQALTPQNLATARENAEAQVRKLLLAMGFPHVVISFRE